MKECWNELSDANKLFIPIFAVNLMVFAVWRMAEYQMFMLRLFCQTPANPNVCLPMILSIFSHFSPFHFISNMYTLLSFTRAAASTLSQEQFVCLYLTSGVVSSLASYTYKIYLNQPGLSLGAVRDLAQVYDSVNKANVQCVAVGSCDGSPGLRLHRVPKDQCRYHICTILCNT